YGLRSWPCIASFLPGKCTRDCKDRWYNWLDPNLKEYVQPLGQILVVDARSGGGGGVKADSVVYVYGLRSWPCIASFLPGKCARDCKDRWYNWLDPNLKVGKTGKLGQTGLTGLNRPDDSEASTGVGQSNEVEVLEKSTKDLEQARKKDKELFEEAIGKERNLAKKNMRHLRKK
ncbi:snRNA-activating protein complex subunit 4, partial [Tanacetum coccineum]